MFDTLKKVFGMESSPLVDIAKEKFTKNPGAPGMTPEEAKAFIDMYGKTLFRIDPSNPDEFQQVFAILTR
jgi:hypothetical protein